MGHRIRDGDLYKIAVIADKSFTIRYRYSTESEREKWEPTPIYSDFISEPVYTAKGIPFATAYQDVCEHYVAKPNINSEKWCDKGCKSTSQKMYPDWAEMINKSVVSNLSERNATIHKYY